MSEWQPIKNAPLREAVIVHNKFAWNRIASLLEDGKWYAFPDNYELSYMPTHWASIPDEPCPHGR